jgi:hypothetical protein
MMKQVRLYPRARTAAALLLPLALLCATPALAPASPATSAALANATSARITGPPASAAPDAHAAAVDTLDIDRLLWSATALQRLLGDRDYATALLLGLAGREYADQVAAAADIRALVARLGSRGAEFDACRRALDPVEGTLCALERLHGVAPASLRPALADEATRLVSQALRAPQPLVGAASGMLLQRQDALQRYVEAQLGALTQPSRLTVTGLVGAGAAGAAPDVVAALEPWLRARIGVAPGDPAATILARNPTLASLLAAYPVLGDVRAGRLQPQALQHVVGSYHAFFAAVVDSTHGTVRRIGALADGATTVAAGLPPADRALEWAAGRAFVHLTQRTAALAGGGDAVAAGLAALGNAAVDLQRGLDDVRGGWLQAGRSVAALALTGNVLGVASGLTALLNVTGASHTTAVNEVRALRTVVDSLRMQVDGRFDHLDAAVDSVLFSLSGGFARLERAVATEGAASRREIAAVHADVLALGARIDRLQADLHELLAGGFDQDYQRYATQCLQFRERQPLEQMSRTLFDECLLRFRQRGASEAGLALRVDRTTPAMDDAAVVAALADTSLTAFAYRLPLLARAAAERYAHSGPVAPGALMNKVEWAAAADAYLRMLAEWPAHADFIGAADLDALIAAGNALDRWSRGLTAAGGAQSQPTLYRTVLADYSRAATELRATVERFAERQRQQGLQRIPRDELVRQIVPVDGTGPALDVPRGILDRVPADALAAAMLGLQPLELRYRVALQDSVVRDGFRRGFLRATRHDRHHYVRPVITIEAVLGGRLVSAYRAQAAFVLQRTERMIGGEDSERVEATTVHVTDPVASFLADGWPRLARDGEWTQLPGGDMAGLRPAVEAELARMAAQSVDGLVGAVCTGGALPPGSEQEAGAIRRALESMTAARALLGDFVRAGFGQTSAFDPDLSALRQGGDGVPDRASVCATLRRGDGMLRVLWLEDRPGAAAARAAAVLDARLADAASLPESPELVASTLERLEAARRIQLVRTRGS